VHKPTYSTRIERRNSVPTVEGIVHYYSTPHHRRFVRSITNGSGGVGFMSLVMRGDITAGSRTDGDVGLSPPVQKPLFRTGGDEYFPIKNYIQISIIQHLYSIYNI